MANSTKSDLLARTYAVLRGAMVIVFSVALILVPEKAVPGSSLEPARSLALMFASRTILLGLVLAALAIRGKRQGLAWVLLADAALQIFDTGLALAMSKGAVAALPLLLGALDVWMALRLFRVADERQALASGHLQS
jgi:hypothetical protein